MTTTLDRDRVLIVPGHALPKGSLKCVGRNGHHRIIDDNPHTREWLGTVALAATALDLEIEPTQPVGVRLVVALPRPASHYRTGRNAHLLRGNAPPYPTRRQTGDIDKLARLVLDALQQANVLTDDAQVVDLVAHKRYANGNRPGIRVELYPLEEHP